jgi:hypothetical protein
MTINFNDITDTATPTSGTFNTGGNSNVKGAGQNSVIQSNAFTTGTGWAVVASTSTGSQADPFGGSTAYLLTADGTSSGHNLQCTPINFIAGLVYTTSVYFKAGTNNFVQIRMTGAVNGQFANFNISTGVVGTSSTTSASIVSVGNGWYRASITYTANATPSGALGIFIVTSNTASGAEVNTLATSIYVYGAQVEIGPTANTYVPTTTVAIYNTPQLTLSGVANIGLQSDGALFVQPAGTGALQASATTSSATGGNARGANAVDWGTTRYQANQVASGANSVIAGGYAHVASGIYSFVGGGNQAIASGSFSAVCGGVFNQATGTYGSVVNGSTNTASGFYGFVGNGFTNSTTSNSVVTTQSATMNGTTAVTLAASNASIKVGQYISGTSIGSDTYVAAVSGTSLTLSKVATGSSTSTLSFYTPHGIVVGGGNNQATGSYSFIGGGGDAGSTASRNAASGDWSFVGGGKGNISSAVGSFIGGGGVQTGFAAGNTASGEGSFIGGGLGNNVTTSGASVVGGYQNTASGIMSGVVSGRRGATRGITGNIVLPACNVPIFDAAGVSQAAFLVLGKETTNATATVLTSDGGAGSTVNQVILPNNSAYYFKGSVIANVTGAASGAAWSFEGAIMRGANAASTVLIGTPVLNRIAVSSGASLWSIALTADTTNGGLAVTVTGVASTTIRWVAKLETTEVTY